MNVYIEISKLTEKDDRVGLSFRFTLTDERVGGELGTEVLELPELKRERHCAKVKSTVEGSSGSLSEAEV